MEETAERSAPTAESTNPGWLEVWLEETLTSDPPGPFLTWSDDAFRRHLANRGFDLSKSIVRIEDMRGTRWIQRSVR